MRYLAAIVTVSLLFIPAVAAAEDAPEMELHLDGGTVTDFPLAIGVGGTLEMPHRTRVGLSVGYLPAPYLDAINDIVVGLGGYDQKTADLIALSLGDSIIWHVSAGWMPWGGHGLFVDLGYRFIGLGGGVGQQTVLSEATGYTIPEVDNATLYDVDAQVHMASLDVGWQWLMLDDALVLTTSVGFTTTLSATATVEDRYGIGDVGGMIPDVDVPGAGELSKIANLNNNAEDLIVSSFEDHVHSPVVSLSLMYRVF